MGRCSSTDVLVEILQWLPPSSRRRARLVCRLWRDVVDERTTEMQSRAKPLLWNTCSAIAYVVDNLPPYSTGSCRELWRAAANLQLVGTCNGLLCLCDNYMYENKMGGDVTLVNPATKESLAVPPLPCATQFVGRHVEAKRWDKAYSFTYHPTSGRYKVVHVPCSFNRVCEFNTLYVLTLSVRKEAIWREVPAPQGARCNLDAGILSVDGVTYWVTDGGAARVVSFDLDDERATFSTPPLPALSYDYNLTVVRGRLGLVVRNRAGTRDAWVLEEGGWIRLFSVTCSWQDIPRPIFAFGEYFLKREGSTLYMHQPKRTSSSPDWRLAWDVLKVGQKDRGTQVTKMIGDDTYYCYNYYQIYAYVSTLEPLDVYSTKSG